MNLEEVANKVIEKYQKKLLNGQTMITAIIEPVSRCNLACKYCAANAWYNRPPFKVISKKVIDDFIEKLSDYAIRNRVYGELLMHGYEPLQAGIETFAYVQDKAKETGLDQYFRFGTQTNGVLINDEWADFFYKNGWGVGVSIDGPKEYHDANRVFPNGKGTYDLAMRGALLLKEKFGHFPGIISVITKAHTKPSIDDAVQKYYQWLEKYNIKSALLHWASWDPRNPHIKEYVMTPEETKEWFIKMYNLWKNKDDGRRIGPYFMIVEAMIRGRARFGSCFLRNGCWKVIGIDHNGTVHLCDRWSYVMKPISQYKKFEDIFKDPEMKKQALRAYMLRNYDPHCKNCKYFNICQGGCTNEGLGRYYLTKEGIRGVPQWTRTQFCEVYKALFAAIERDLKKRGVPLRFS